ncbi:hypothetical protein V8B97DRAFT_1868232, partial [Scleroderma yunnanense]
VLLALASAVVAGAKLSAELHNQACNPHCLYLCHSKLMSDPQINAPWKKLFDTRDDHGFIRTIGINVDTFDFILHARFAQDWYSTPISHQDTDGTAIACPT